MAKLRNFLLALVMFTACAGAAAGIDAEVPEGACSAAVAQGDLDGASALLQRAVGHDGGRKKSALTLAAFDEGHLRQWAKNASLPEDAFEKFSAALHRLPDVKLGNVSGTRLGTAVAELLGNLMNITLGALDKSARALARHSLQGRSSIREHMAAARSGTDSLEQVQAITSHVVRVTSQDFGNVSRDIKALQVSVSVGLFAAGIPSNVSMRLLKPLLSASQEFEEALEDLSAAEAEISSLTSSKAKEQPRACCKAMTADCLACVDGVSGEEYCKENPKTAGCDPEPKACCYAMTADCLACADGVSTEEFCKEKPETAGCEALPAAPEIPPPPSTIAATEDASSLLTFLKLDTAEFERKVANFGRELKMSLFHIQDYVMGRLGSTPAVFGHDLQVADGIAASLSDGARSFVEGANEGSTFIAQKAGAAAGLVTRTVFLFIGIVAATNPAFAL